MFEFLANIDEALFIFLHRIARGDAIDCFMWLISNKFIWIPLYFALAYFLFRQYGPRGFAWLLIGLLLATLITDQLCSSVIRPLVARMRPTNTENELSDIVYTVRGIRGGEYGFPSCHAANTAMLTAFMYLTTRSGRLLRYMTCWTVLICLSRIYLGLHYPGDILFGALIGIGIAWCIYRLVILFLKKRYNYSLKKPVSKRLIKVPIIALLLSFALIVSVSLVLVI